MVRPVIATVAGYSGIAASAALDWASFESLLLRGRVLGRVRGLRYS